MQPGNRAGADLGLVDRYYVLDESRNSVITTVQTIRTQFHIEAMQLRNHRTSTQHNTFALPRQKLVQVEFRTGCRDSQQAGGVAAGRQPAR